MAAGDATISFARHSTVNSSAFNQKSLIFLTNYVNLILRHLHADGVTSLEITSKTLKISIPILGALFRELRQQHLVEVKGAVGEDYAFILTTAGHDLATERFRICRYVGPAPVNIR